MKITTTIFFFLMFTLAIAIPPVILQFTGNGGLLAAGFWVLFGFMSTITFIILMGMLIIKHYNEEYFTAAFLGGTTFKILACLIFIFILLHNKPADKYIFVADFMYIYFVNTVFEVFYLLRTLRNQKTR